MSKNPLMDPSYGDSPPTPGDARQPEIAWEARPAWGTFRTGLLLMILGIGLGLLLLFAMVVAFAGMFSAAASAQPGKMPDMPRPDDTITLFFVWSALYTLCGMWVITGYLLTPSVPSESGASPWGILCFLALLGAAALYVVLLWNTIRSGGQILGKELLDTVTQQQKPKMKAPAPDPEKLKALIQAGQILDPDLAMYLLYSLIVCLAVSKLCFTLTLWQVARFLRSGASWSVCLYMLFLILAVTFVTLGLQGKLPIMKEDPQELARVLALAVTFGPILFVAWMLINLMAVRGAITSALLRPATPK